MAYTNKTRVSYFGAVRNLGDIIDNRLHAFLLVASNGETYEDGYTGETYMKHGDALYLRGKPDGDDFEWHVIGSALSTSKEECRSELSRAHAETPLEQNLPKLAPGTNLPGVMDGEPVNVRIDTRPVQVTKDLPPIEVNESALEKITVALDKADEFHRAQAMEDQLCAPEKSWRCFHCDALFTNYEDAHSHFGASEVFAPICHLSPDDIRAMELELHRYREEDTELHRKIAYMRAEFETEKRSHGDTEYAKGIRDARLEGIEPIARETATQIIDAVMGAVDVLRSPMIKAQAWGELEAVDMAPGAISYQETIARKAEEIIAEGNVMQLPRGHGKVKTGGMIDEAMRRRDQTAEAMSGVYAHKEVKLEPPAFDPASVYTSGYIDAVEMVHQWLITHCRLRGTAEKLTEHVKGISVRTNAERYFSK